MGRPTAGWGSINCAGAGQPGRVWQARTAPGVAMLPGEAGINVRKTARYASKDCDPLQYNSLSHLEVLGELFERCVGEERFGTQDPKELPVAFKRAIRQRRAMVELSSNREGLP